MNARFPGTLKIAGQRAAEANLYHPDIPQGPTEAILPDDPDRGSWGVVCENGAGVARQDMVPGPRLRA